jgi:tetratricopeptide (TPR) repeat protein
MPDVAKLKKKAAELELKKQFDKALAVYVEILDSYEGSAEEVDVALFNRVGDIYLKQGNVADAVDYYEKAVDHYIDTGFYNNAIALCNKILRSSPGRATIYYKLGKVSAHKGFKSDAKANYLEYADRMQKSGKLDEAFRALKEFADLCPDQDDIRLMLADQLSKAKRGSEAVEQLQLVYELYVQEGREAEAEATVMRMKQIEPNAQPRSPGASKSRNTGDLVFLDLNDSGPPKAPSGGRSADLPFIQPTPPAAPPAAVPPAPRPAAPPAPRAAAPVEPLIEPEPMPELIDTPGIEPAVLDGLTRAIDFENVEGTPHAGLLDGLVSTGFDDDASLSSGSLLDLDSANFGSSSAPLDEGLAGIGDNLLDFDMMPQSAPEPPRPAAKAPLHPSAPPKAPAASPRAAQPQRPALGDLPMLDSDDRGSNDPPAGGDLELMDIELSATPRPRAASVDAGEFQMLDLSPTSGAEPEEAETTAQEPLTARRSSTIMAVQSVENLQSMTDSAPDDNGLRRQLAEAMLESGDREGGLRELEVAMVGFERADDLDAASSIADEIVRLVPGSVRHLQKRVEYAFRQNERGRLIEAYLELADALFRAGTVDKSRAIYQRVLDLAPDDVRAQAALETMPAPAPVAPPPAAPAKGGARASAPPSRPQAPAAQKPPAQPAAAADDDFVNLGDLLRADDTRKSTRMVVEEQEPSGDEEADFADMLRKFKQGILENVEEEDHQSHYDLGVAYKEMGLLDEAIAEFQKALRAPTNRVPTYEALGASFIEKGQYPMAATILTRALSEPGVNDDLLVGVLYLLGRCAEERGVHDVALEYYQRVFVVDIQFRDVGERLAAVEGARS